MLMRNCFAKLSLFGSLALVLCGCTGDGSGSGMNLGSLTSGVSGMLGKGGNTGGVDAGAVANGVQTGVQSFALSYADEPAMGQSVAAVAISKYGLVDDPKLTRYVALVGLTVVSASQNPDAEWFFAVLNTDEVNAFSGPAGYVMITRGAIAKMHDESELAGVLAHEISHVLNHDGLNAAKHALLVKGITQAAAGASARFAQFEGGTNGALDTIVVNGYNQDQENKADADAVSLVAAAGYDPHGYLHFITRLAALKHSGGGSIMSTHPGLESRVARISAKITAIGSPTGQTLEDRFQTRAKDALQ